MTTGQQQENAATAVRVAVNKYPELSGFRVTAVLYRFVCRSPEG